MIVYLSRYYFLFFFFYRHGNRRDLHSFPTRRSSDLGVGVLEGADSRAPRHGGDTAVNVDDRITTMTRRDRKSTRLNSSHQIISYAVFCLKKKIKLMMHT